MLRRLALSVVALVLLGAAGAFAYFVWVDQATPADPAMQRSDAQEFSLIERGRYLTTAADCEGCHNAPGEGSPFAGGAPIETPFGTILAPNITPDRDTGVGAWSDSDFDAAVRRGRRRDGALLYPAMPYPYYAKMSPDDVLAIRAYLGTVKPVRNKVAANQLPFPFSVRASMHVWNALYFSAGAFAADAAKSAVWNRGAYLVEGPGHCGACHTPKTLLGGDEISLAFRGYAIQGWFAPEITNDAQRGLGSWSIQDIADYLKTGHNRIAAATGPMAEEVTFSSSKLNDEDLAAIATYLKDLPGESDVPTPLSSADPAMSAGGAIYRDLCTGCHAIDGKGSPGLFPALASSSGVRSADASTLIRVMIRGARSVATPGEPTSPAMPSFGWQLGDEQIAAVLTYIRNNWGSAAPAVSPDEVSKARRALAWRND